MNTVAKIVAPLALVATVLPSVLFLFHALGEGAMKTTMLLGTVAWFVFAPKWMKGGDQ
jgi:hypothetical protein